MNQKKYIVLLVAMFFPIIATAQFFEKQKVAVWEIRDNNNDAKVATATKSMMHSCIVEAFVASRNYEAFNVDINEINSCITSKGLTKSPSNIAKIIREMHEVDYVLFTNLQVLEHSITYDNRMLLISQLFSTETQKNVRAAYQEMRSNINDIPTACAALLGELLGEKLAPQVTMQSPDASQHSEILQHSSDGPQNYVEQTLVGLNMSMVYVEGGTFQMGATSEQFDSFSDEYPVHSVQLSSFYMSATEVTQAQWQTVMGTTILQQVNKYYPDDGDGLPDDFVGPDCPMFCVSWEEAQVFCRELSRLTGRTYLLPTEAQWEYAARGGQKSSFTPFAGSYSVDAVAWYELNSFEHPHLVGERRSNELGLYDMSGNVWEWCSDWHGDYSSDYQFDPIGPLSGDRRVIRGGSWDKLGYACRVAARGSFPPYSVDPEIGFRVVCIP